MGEPHPQALRRRTSQLLELMKHVAGVEPKLEGENLGTGAQSQDRLRLSPLLGGESRQLLFEGLHVSPEASTRDLYRSDPPSSGSAEAPSSRTRPG
jgi:hypothetical protein